jgi:hypothetical protein
VSNEWSRRYSAGVTDDSRDLPNDRPALSMTSTAEVAAVVEKVKKAHRGKIRWAIGRHTAELALNALRKSPRHKLKRPSSPKARRRKRHKRML